MIQPDNPGLTDVEFPCRLCYISTDGPYETDDLGNLNRDLLSVWIRRLKVRETEYPERIRGELCRSCVEVPVVGRSRGEIDTS